VWIETSHNTAEEGFALKVPVIKKPKDDLN